MQRRHSTIFGLLGLLLAREAHADVPWFDAAWSVRQEVRLTEPGVTTRTNEYIDVTVVIPKGTSTNLSAELRIIDAQGAQGPSFVRSQQGDVAFVVLARTVALGAQESLYLYWGNKSASPPAYTFPNMRFGYFAWNDPPNVFYQYELPTLQALFPLRPYDRIPMAIYPLRGRSAYSQAFVRTLRVAAMSPYCDVPQYLATTTLAEDVSIFAIDGVGNCIRSLLFGLADPSIAGPVGGPVQVPSKLSYVTQDFTPGQSLGITCSNGVAVANASPVELLADDVGALACMLRWEPGSKPGPSKLAYRSFYSGLFGDQWNAAYTLATRRALESILQNNRVIPTLVGNAQYLCNGKTQSTPPSTEICDGIDNDCNGVVDDTGNALCASNAQGTQCLSGASAGCGCATDQDCTVAAPLCNSKTRRCDQACRTDADCKSPGRTRCSANVSAGDAGADRCVQCLRDADCLTYGRATCDPFTGDCRGLLPEAGVDAGTQGELADSGSPPDAGNDAAAASPGPAVEAGGCSCQTGTRSSGGNFTAGLALAAALALVRRRHQRSSTTATGRKPAS